MSKGIEFKLNFRPGSPGYCISFLCVKKWRKEVEVRGAGVFELRENEFNFHIYLTVPLPRTPIPYFWCPSDKGANIGECACSLTTNSPSKSVPFLFLFNADWKIHLSAFCAIHCRRFPTTRLSQRTPSSILSFLFFLPLFSTSSWVSTVYKHLLGPRFATWSHILFSHFFLKVVSNERRLFLFFLAKSKNPN